MRFCRYFGKSGAKTLRDVVGGGDDAVRASHASRKQGFDVQHIQHGTEFRVFQCNDVMHMQKNGALAVEWTSVGEGKEDGCLLFGGDLWKHGLLPQNAPNGVLCPAGLWCEPCDRSEDKGAWSKSGNRLCLMQCRQLNPLIGRFGNGGV